MSKIARRTSISKQVTEGKQRKPIDINEMGDLVRKDMEQAEVLNAIVY